jgi:cyclopropane-fatty-acyl-phospholipid synthase
VKASVLTQHQTFSNRTVRVASTWFDRWALGRVRNYVAGAPIRFALWDGFALEPTSGEAAGTILFKNRQALLSWARDPDLNFGETYMFGAVEIGGDLVATVEAACRVLAGRKASVLQRLWPSSNSVDTARENVHHHYDLGNDFYRLWLDREMVYTCAYFPTRETTLEDAQIAKMDLVCRKLRLKPGERVVEAGCGWGSLALHMARCYGVTVRAFNVSTEQIAYARERAAAERLDARVEFVEDDYRNIRGSFDAFVSVGMLEHVGLADYPTLGRVIDRSLGPDGRGLLHFIGRNRPAPLNPWVRTRIFPGAYPPTLREVSEHVLEPQGFSVLDVENLRLHYAQTLAHWLARFNDHAGRAREMFDDVFVRAWRLYLAVSQAAFTTGSMQLFQIVFARGDTNAIPWTRVSG